MAVSSLNLRFYLVIVSFFNRTICKKLNWVGVYISELLFNTAECRAEYSSVEPNHQVFSEILNYHVNRDPAWSNTCRELLCENKETHGSGCKWAVYFANIVKQDRKNRFFLKKGKIMLLSMNVCGEGVIVNMIVHILQYPPLFFSTTL